MQTTRFLLVLLFASLGVALVAEVAVRALILMGAQ